LVWNKFKLKEVIEEMKEEEKEKIIGKTVKDVIRSPEATKILRMEQYCGLLLC